ncbi:hypothetical protein IA539_10500 [Gordonia sp. zg691]|uniref:hypothetical protein n=1 Tax=Gordonia jinghuaiqii TaxID=2758710 RepID=UPI0016627A59|nr:hypothetical protein [Gordonia jinghuaiqii]MBD0861636.1 hypothetical protein [Gordonia jinghuaiqii]
MTSYPVDRFGLIRRGVALAAAFSDNQLAAAVKNGDLIRLVPGVAVENCTDFGGHEGAQKLHRLTAIAVVTSEYSTGRALPLSHASAATVLGVPLLKPDIDRVHVTNGKHSGGAVLTHRHVHAAPVDDDEIVEVDGISVTSLERTAVDVATTGDFAQALTAMDQALRAGADRAVIDRILASRRRKGIRVARRALALADGASESVGESWSRAQMIEAGLPTPRLQHHFHCRTGSYRADFNWDELLIGEFDGMVKYGRLRAPGQTVADAVIQEKLREDELRALGAVVVRWTWPLLESGGLVELLRPWLVKLELAA